MIIVNPSSTVLQAFVIPANSYKCELCNRSVAFALSEKVSITFSAVSFADLLLHLLPWLN